MTAVRFRARLGRTGAQSYADGEQHRDANEVFSPASLAGLAGLRVQRGHDPLVGRSVGRIVPGTIGRVDHADAQGRSYITAELEIFDAATAADIRAGRLHEISLAYESQLRMGADGKKYQTLIRYAGPEAHVALLDSRTERARCGEHCALAKDSMAIRTDSGGSITADGGCGCTTTDASVMLDSASGVVPDGAVHAVLDAAAASAGVARSKIVDEMARTAGSRAHISYELVRDAIFNCSLHGGRLLQAAKNATDDQPGSPVTSDAGHDDDAFRAALARKL